ncbi:TPA_asm: M [Hibiscus gammacytorhabdovirus 1]|nr:TPA_asm: M [Hibiscus gammacytorhabdovirus 1]
MDVNMFISNKYQATPFCTTKDITVSSSGEIRIYGEYKCEFTVIYDLIKAEVQKNKYPQHIADYLELVLWYLLEQYHNNLTVKQDHCVIFGPKAVVTKLPLPRQFFVLSERNIPEYNVDIDIATSDVWRMEDSTWKIIICVTGTMRALTSDEADISRDRNKVLYIKSDIFNCFTEMSSIIFRELPLPAQNAIEES